MILDISPEAEAVLERKALVLGAPLSDVLNAMILEFAPSTPAEKELCGKVWQMERAAFERDHPNATTWQAWRAGYVFGWMHFQVRKRNLFDLRDGGESHG